MLSVLLQSHRHTDTTMEQTTIYILILISTVFSPFPLGRSPQAHVVLGYHLNVNCTQDGNCGSGGACVKGTCECQGEMTVFAASTAQCVQAARVPYESACVSSEQCVLTMGVGAVCGTDLTCGCYEGYHYLKGQCWPNVGLGEVCTNDESCFVNYDPLSTNCTEGRCACSEGYYQVGTVDCRRNVTELDESCDPEIDEVCPGMLTEDLRGDYEYVSSENSIAYMDPCDNDSACESLSNSRCFLGNCICDLGYFLDPATKSSCTPEIGMTCSSSSQCLLGVANSECRGGVCVCQTNYARSYDNRQCTVMKKFGARCSPKKPELCSSYGYECSCIQVAGTSYSACSCSEGFHYEEDDAVCWPSKELGEECVSSKDCYLEGSLCSSKATCQCDSSRGYYQSSDKKHCIKNITDLGAACYTAGDCQSLGPNIDCATGVCNCSSGYYYNAQGKDPLCLAGINGKCTDSGSECTLPNTICQNGLCGCAGNYTLNEAKDGCLAVRYEEGEECTENGQCTSLGVGSTCSDGICTCGDQYHYHDKKCWISKRIGESCKALSECVGSSTKEDSQVVCRNKVCQCSFDYQLDEDGQTCIPSSSSDLATPGLMLVAVWALGATKII